MSDNSIYITNLRFVLIGAYHKRTDIIILKHAIIPATLYVSIVDQLSVFITNKKYGIRLQRLVYVS